MKKSSYFYIVFFIVMIISVVSYAKKSTPHYIDSNHFERIFLSLVRDTALHMQKQSSQLNEQETRKLLQLFAEVRSTSKFAPEDPQNFQSQFLCSQRAFEYVIAYLQSIGKITSLSAIFHTPFSADLLSFDPYSDAPELFDPSTLQNHEKITQSRTQMIQTYLENQGKLYILYPKKNLEKYSTKQQKIYKQILSQYKNQLIDHALSTHQLNPEMTGTTYIFKTSANKTYALFFKTINHSEWEIWFGNMQDPEISLRISQICNYLKSVKGPDLLESIR